MQLREVERALDPVDLRLVGTEAALEPSDHVRGRGRTHLDADDVAEAPPAELGLDRLEQVVGIVRDLEVRVAGDAEDGALDDGDAREERGKEMRDDLLERDVQPAPVHLEEARETFGDLDACEPLLAQLCIDREDGERQREPGDVREGLAGSDGERREDGIDLALEALLELAEVLVAEILDATDGDTRGFEGGPQLPLPEARLQSRELEDALADPRERLVRRQPVGGPDGEPGLRLPEEARDPDLEELVEVLREERAALHALEQREGVVSRELENARVELEVRELAVEQRVLLGSRFRRHRTLIGTTGHRISMPEAAPPEKSRGATRAREAAGAASRSGGRGRRPQQSRPRGRTRSGRLRACV